MIQGRHEEIVKTLKQGQAAVTRVEAVVADRPGRREVKKIALIAAIGVSLLMGAISITVSISSLRATARSDAEAAAHKEADEKAYELSTARAEEAYNEAKKANDQLAQQGRPQVRVPRDRGHFVETIVAAATAQVLASLPPQITAPNATQLQAAVEKYLTSKPLPLQPEQITNAIGAYFAEHPPKGRGVQSVALNDENKLVIKYTDGTTDITSRSLRGAPGRPPYSWNWTTPEGVTYRCARNNQDDNNPTYICRTEPSNGPTNTPTR